MNPFITLDKNHILGIPEMDSEHEQLVKLINTLADAVAENEDGNRRTELLKQIIIISKKHFEDEEALMASVNYSALELHKTLHRALLNKLEELSGRINEGALAINQAFVNYLKDWLLKHIIGTDKEYAKVILK